MDTIQTNVKLQEAVPKVRDILKCSWRLDFLEVLEEVAAWYPFHDEVICFTVFEGGVAFDDMLRSDRALK